MSADITPNATSRRDFLTYSSAAVAASALAAGGVYAAADDTIKIGLIGAGGRGRGAAVDALRADPNIKLTRSPAMPSRTTCRPGSSTLRRKPRSSKWTIASW